MSTRSKPVAQLRGRPTTQAASIKPLVGALDVPIEQVEPDPTQPRRDWEHDEGPAHLHELADSIREFGILQPLVVRQEGTFGDGRPRYVIINGGRRYAAATEVGLPTLPVVVRGGEAGHVRMLQLIENLQRQSLSPLDEARAFQELIDLEHGSAEALGQRLHISGQHIRNRLRLLTDQILSDAVERRQISATAAHQIMQLPDEELMVFRSRVQAGEKLVSNDIAAARARAAAAGITHPRWKGGGRVPRPLKPSSPPEATAQAGPDHTRRSDTSDSEGDRPEVPGPAVLHAIVPQDQTTFDPVPSQPDQTTFDRTPDHPRTSGSAGERLALIERVAATLVLHLPVPQRPEVAAALDQLTDEQWAGLLVQALRDQLRAAQTDAASGG